MFLTDMSGFLLLNIANDFDGQIDIHDVMFGEKSMNYTLREREVVSLTIAGALSELFVKEGHVWLTRAGDPRDYVLKRGDRLPLEGDGSYILEALVEATFKLEGLPEKDNLTSLHVNLKLHRTSPLALAG